MKKKRYLPLYYKFIESGLMDEAGLCRVIMYHIGMDEAILFYDLFSPTCEEAGDDAFWLSTILEKISDPIYTYRFNEMRQNALLLMAAMNNEL